MWTLSSDDLPIRVGQSIHLDIELGSKVKRVLTGSVLVAYDMICFPLNRGSMNKMPKPIDKIKGIARGIRDKPRVKNLEGRLVVTSNVNGTCSNSKVLTSDVTTSLPSRFLTLGLSRIPLAIPLILLMGYGILSVLPPFNGKPTMLSAIKIDFVGSLLTSPLNSISKWMLWQIHTDISSLLRVLIELPQS